MTKTEILAVIAAEISSVEKLLKEEWNPNSTQARIQRVRWNNYVSGLVFAQSLVEKIDARNTNDPA